MEVLAEWLPKIGCVLVILVGLVGFFKPTMLLEPMKIQLGSNEAISEARGVFGGLNLGTGSAALYLGDPTLYAVMGFAWLCVTAARPFSMIVDGTTLKESIAPLVFDITIALLFLSQYLLSPAA